MTLLQNGQVEKQARFDGKNKDEITILQHNLVRFLHFSPITIDNLNLNPQKNVKIHRKYLC